MQSVPIDHDPPMPGRTEQLHRARSRVQRTGPLHGMYRALVPLPEEVPIVTVKHVLTVDRVVWIATGTFLVAAAVLQSLVSILAQGMHLAREGSIALHVASGVGLTAVMVLLVLRRVRPLVTQHVHGLRDTYSRPATPSVGLFPPVDHGTMAIWSQIASGIGNGTTGEISSASVLRGHSVSNGPTEPGVPSLTGRQLALLQLLAQGYTVDQVAAACQTTNEMIELRLRTTLQRLQSRTPAQAVATALRHGLIL